MSTSVLAFVTMIHLSLVVLRVHRSTTGGLFSFVKAISFLFSASPWLLSSPSGLAIGLAVHAGWFIACEQLLPSPGQARAVQAGPPAPRRPAGIAELARRPREFVQAPVVAVFEETPDIRTYRLARPEGFEFKAGQFLTVRVRADGKEHVRCYSISSAPAARGHLEITVKRIGLVSGTLHATVRPGSTLSVRAPAGAFVYPADEDRPLVFIAGGVGITPLMSMLRHAIDADPTRPITLFYSVRTMDDVAFEEELMWLNRRHAQVRVFIAVTDGSVRGDCFPGRINESLVRTTVRDPEHALYLLCGPAPMLEAMTALLTSIGVPRPQVSFEVFQAAVAASAGRPQPAAGADEPADRDGDAFDAQFKKSAVTTKVGSGETLLDASETCGATIPSLCRAGVCGTCRTRVLSGKVDCRSQVLDDVDRQEGFVLACVTHVQSDCTVDA